MILPDIGKCSYNNVYVYIKNSCKAFKYMLIIYVYFSPVNACTRRNRTYIMDTHMITTKYT